MNYFMGEIAEFSKQKKRTLKDNILGTTKSGRAFRIGSAVSLAGLGTLALKKRGSLNKQSLKNAFTKETQSVSNPVIQKLDETGAVYYTRNTINKPKGLFGTGRVLKWGNIGKATGIGAGAILIPTGAAYAYGNENDRNKIKKHTTTIVRVGRGVGKAAKSTINTLHKVSR